MMSIIIQIIFFGALGTIIGSFIAHITYATVHGQAYHLLSRSQCDHCKHVLAPGDLVPIVSYLRGGGVCRYCSKKISGYYPLIEGITAVFFVITSFLFTDLNSILNYPFPLLIFLLYLSIALYVSFTDVQIQAFSIIPLWGGICISLLASAFLQVPVPIMDSILGLVIGTSILLLISGLGYLWKRNGVMGSGDIYLIAFLGSTLGMYNTIVALYIAVLSGAFIGIIGKKMYKMNTIAFGPFLCIGWYLAYLYGNVIISTYLSLLS